LPAAGEPAGVVGVVAGVDFGAGVVGVAAGVAGLAGAVVVGLVCASATDENAMVKAMVAKAPWRTRIVDVSSMLFSQPALGIRPPGSS
jgi:hypothetical protein